jgi:hypothetical protein
LSAASEGAPNPIDIVHELRQQAVEVRNELDVTRQHSGRYWNASFTVLSLAGGVYGGATDQVAATAVGLLPLLQLLMAHDHSTEAAVDKLQQRPGYVLVKAQDILAHAH